MSSPIVSSSPRIAVVGLGGYARHHHLTLQRLERAGLCRVVATCEPDMARLLPQSVDLHLPARRITVHPDFNSLLEALSPATVDAITLPVPIHLHAPMHRACVLRGIPVYLEKPPTLWWAELEDMVAGDAGAPRPTEVGFNFITEATRQSLKARLLAGEFGALHAVHFYGLWPRPAAYFSRNNWAGRIFLRGTEIPLLDSGFGNAMGHFIQNLLYWAGTTLAGFATIQEVRAVLARAHAIEGADTFFAEARTPGGVCLRVGLSHACARPDEQHHESIVCERATICYVTERNVEIRWRDGRREEIDLRQEGDWQERNFRRFFSYLAGLHAAPVVSLADCRPFVAFNDLLYASSPGIATIEPADFAVSGEGSAAFRAVAGLPQALARFVHEGQWPHEGGFAWAKAPSRAHLSDLPLALAKIRALTGGAPANTPPTP